MIEYNIAYTIVNLKTNEALNYFRNGLAIEEVEQIFKDKAGDNFEYLCRYERDGGLTQVLQTDISTILMWTEWRFETEF